MEREFSAGGVLVRNFHGRPFAVCIRLKQGSVLALPKGHPHEGESMAEAAAREVREETGCSGDPVERLGEVKYWYVRKKKGDRVFKVVTFFLFRYRAGSIRDHDDEVEEAEWIPLADLPGLLTYETEREMAARALARVEGLDLS